MELFAKIVNSWKSLSISAKNTILDVLLGFEYVSASFFPGTLYIIVCPYPLFLKGEKLILITSLGGGESEKLKQEGRSMVQGQVFLIRGGGD